SGTYSTTTQDVAAEPIPVGLARQLYEALADPQYDGQISLAAAECPALGLGCVLNLTGGRPEWLSARALVQTAEYDIDSGTTTLRFGPANHLGVADIIELLRAARQRRITISYSARLTGTKAGSGANGLGLLTPTTSAVPQNDGSMGKLRLQSLNNLIEIDPALSELGTLSVVRPDGTRIGITALFPRGQSGGDTITLKAV
ncbi:MAG TPA: hypothetical protein VMB21_17970, partial [Candidatus Limnocylindria bacterium]|nr:hypothetical protein [Candidatus Limnocylindria bacterium]